MSDEEQSGKPCSSQREGTGGKGCVVCGAPSRTPISHFCSEECFLKYQIVEPRSNDAVSEANEARIATLENGIREAIEIAPRSSAVLTILRMLVAPETSPRTQEAKVDGSRMGPVLINHSLVAEMRGREKELRTDKVMSSEAAPDVAKSYYIGQSDPTARGPFWVCGACHIARPTTDPPPVAHRTTEAEVFGRYAKRVYDDETTATTDLDSLGVRALLAMVWSGNVPVEDRLWRAAVARKLDRSDPGLAPRKDNSNADLGFVASCLEGMASRPNVTPFERENLQAAVQVLRSHPHIIENLQTAIREIEAYTNGPSTQTWTREFIIGRCRAALNASCSDSLTDRRKHDD